MFVLSKDSNDMRTEDFPPRVQGVRTKEGRKFTQGDIDRINAVHFRKLEQRFFASKGEPIFKLGLTVDYTAQKVVTSASGLKPSRRLLRKGNKGAIALVVNKPYAVKTLPELQALTFNVRK